MHGNIPASECGVPAGIVADLSPGPVEKMNFERLTGAKLGFTGRRLARHSQRLPSGAEIAISLWARQKSGYVVVLETLEDDLIRPHAARLATLEDAICFLEDQCSRMPEIALRHEQPEQSLMALLRVMIFRTAFLTLSGEALAAWIELPKETGLDFQDRATA